jgi:hypothetical protein
MLPVICHANDSFARHYGFSRVRRHVSMTFGAVKRRIT